MNKLLPAFALLLSTFSFAQLTDCNDLFISEYVEGWYNNKALEIYNPTDEAIDLSAYMVIRYSNGSGTSATGPEYAIQLVGTVASGDVHVGVLDKRDPNGVELEQPVWDSLQSKADAFYSPIYAENKTWYWNGNDAIVLAKGSPNDIANSIAVDIFGKIEENPGIAWTSEFPYTGNGDEVTKDHSMIRKPSILKGETNPIISFFNPLLEYDSIPAVVERIDENGDPVLGSSGNPILDGNWGSLGSHDCECTTGNVGSLIGTNIDIFPNPSNGIFYIQNISDVHSIKIHDILGKSIFQLINTTNNVTIELNEKNGVYFVQLEYQNGEKVIRKVVIK